ncbi:Vps5-domain-containing protein [Artomyces pyxidatus]|uniref:Vps5-domain-containing protein n=1 Tax=Artomyces pyxidatus TaxID=48021 RepID=A0ACB8SMZ9_9AGAM|nr:Vps5-domain-containing protein [Artomyces pyxidatus]
MSGFDDLLKQSSRALEENPFDDPFAQPRASSPDPWSTYTQPSVPSSNAFDYGTTPAFEDHSTSTPTEESHAFAVHSAPEEPSDPLDSANLESEEEGEPPAKTISSPQYSGFKESVESEPVITAPDPVRKPEPVVTSLPPRSPSPIGPESPPRRAPSPPVVTPSTPSPASAEPFARPPSPAAPSSARLPQRQHVSQPSISSFSPASPKASEPPRLVVSPLEQTTTSFASLALGGESFGGWDGAQSAFINSSAAVSATQDDDDDDDDKPLRPRPSEPTSPTPVPAPKRENGLQPVFTITVDDPQKVGDPIRGYTMYTVHTRTTSPLFSKSSFSVLRRYSDFLWLYETLSLNNPGVVVPPVPEKNPFGRFDDQFVQQRRFALENCITKIANHPVLGKDPDLKLFLESDTFSLDIKHRKAEIAQERGGLMASIGQSFVGPRFVETDEWFDRQKAYLDILESQLRGLVKAIDVVAKHRTELAVAMGEFAQTIGDLAASELGSSLTHSLSALAEVERKTQAAEAAQAQADLATIMTTSDEYARLINSVRMAFSSRVRMYHAWQNADADSRRVRQTHERNRAQGKISTDRLGYSLNQIAEAERRALDAKQEFEQVSRLVKSEVARFEQERIEDFKSALERFLDGMIERQKEIIATREGFQQILLKKVPASGQAAPGSTLTAVA